MNKKFLVVAIVMLSLLQPMVLLSIKKHQNFIRMKQCFYDPIKYGCSKREQKLANMFYKGNTMLHLQQARPVVVKKVELPVLKLSPSKEALIAVDPKYTIEEELRRLQKSQRR